MPDRMGLPKGSESKSGRYKVYEMEPKTGERPTVFDSEVAPVREGTTPAADRTGGGVQTLVLDRSRWTTPKEPTETFPRQESRDEHVARARRARETAEELLLQHSPGSDSVGDCLEQSQPLLAAARLDPELGVDAVPCARFVADGGFDDWPELRAAYSDFYLAATGLRDRY